MNKLRLSLLTLFLLAIVCLRAGDFVTLRWQADTTALGITFAGAVRQGESPFPQYCTDFNLGRSYGGKQYTVSVDYPEYQVVKLPASLKQWAAALPSEPVARTALSRSRHEGVLQVSLVPFVYREGKLMRLNSFRLALSEGTVAAKRSARSTSLRAAAPKVQAYAAHSLLAEGRWVKISVPSTGIYKLSDSRLRELGFSDPSRVRLYGYGGYLLPEGLNQLPPDDLCEMPLWRVSDGILFYGQGTVKWIPSARREYFSRQQNFYARAGYYFLTEAAESASFPQSGEPSGLPADTADVFNDYALYEVDGYNWASSGREMYDSYDFAQGNTRTYSFSCPGLRADLPAYCTVDFAAHHTAATYLQVEANGSQIGRLTVPRINPGDSYYSYYKASTASATYDCPGLAEQNTLTLTYERPTSVSGRLNYLALNYSRDLRLYGSYTAFRSLPTVGRASVLYRVAGASSSTVVWDVTTPGEYAQVPATLEGDVLTFRGDNTTLREYVAVNPAGSFDSPAVVGTVDNQDLHGLEQPDLVIITPASGLFRESAEQLAEAHRAHDGMVVHVVRADQVYNEFSSGTPDATAYRRFMKMFYDRAESGGKSPSYLLLMGDCAYDNRMLSQAWSSSDPDDFLLCYQSKNSVSEINSYVTDDYLGMMDEGEGVNLRADKMDLGVGRFPVRTEQEAADMVAKTVAYIENQEGGVWKNRICYAADDEENRLSNLFMEAAEELSATVEEESPAFSVVRLYQDAYPRVSTAAGHTYPQATARLLELVDDGLMMLNYTGHGGTNGWSAEFLLTGAQIRAMRNARQGLWVTATCDFCRYDDVATTAGEDAFLNPQGGAVALFTTSRTVFSSNNDMLNTAFNGHIFDRDSEGRSPRLGDIMRLAKNEAYLSNDSNKLNFSLIGDPALRLSFPQYRVVLDSIDGRSAASADLQMQAGGLVTLKGHIETWQGEPVPDFSGLVYPTVYDAKEHVVCYNNAHKDTDLEAFEFDQYNNRLFVGSDSVRGGAFSISFPVPLDISYSDEQGMINFYARALDGREGQGAFSNFRVGGTAEGGLQTDSLGPEIDLFLNASDRDPGRPVGPNPVLFATLFDEEGINVAGNGIGHDLTVSIDRDPDYTYVLNDYFQLLSGDYRQGTLQYQFSSLPDGEHTLYLTAWDTKNNSTTVSYPFSVSSSEAPALGQLTCYPVPATDHVTFSFVHDCPGSALTLRFEVFDLSGRPLWETAVTDRSSSTVYTYTWDLTASNGARLPQGVYLYRVHVSENGSSETSEVLKFVVLAQ